MYRLKRDPYRRNRGGQSKVLDIACASCGQHVARYQKDGRGTLKRMYVDRFIGSQPTGEQLVCGNCRQVLGTRSIYEKENRLAYFLRPGAVAKKTHQD